MYIHTDKKTHRQTVKQTYLHANHWYVDIDRQGDKQRDRHTDREHRTRIAARTVIMDSIFTYLLAYIFL